MTSSIWTKEAVEALAIAARTGKSAREIADALNAQFDGARFTRGSVIGKVFRSHGAIALLRPSGGQKPGAQPDRAPVKPKATTRNRIVSPVLRKEAPMICEPMLPAGDGVTMLELTASSCRYPIGDPLHDSFRFCGAKRASMEPNRSYCQFHAALAYQPANDRRRWDRRLGIKKVA